MYLPDAEDPAGSCCNNNDSSADAIDLIVATAAGLRGLYIYPVKYTQLVSLHLERERKSIENLKADPEFVTVAWRKKIKKLNGNLDIVCISSRLESLLLFVFDSF